MADAKRSRRSLAQYSLYVAVPAALACAAYVYRLERQTERQAEQARSVGTEHISRMQSVDAWVRQGAAAVPELVALLSDADGKIRESAALALSRLGPEGSAATDALLAALGDGEPNVRRYALLALASGGEDLEPHVVALAERLGDDDPDVRLAAARAIAHVGLPASSAVSRVLVAAPPDRTAPALAILSHLGTDDADALAAMHRLVADEQAQSNLRQTAFWTLRALEQVHADDVHATLRSGAEPLEHAALVTILDLEWDASPFVDECLGCIERIIGRAAEKAKNPVSVTFPVAMAPASNRDDESRLLGPCYDVLAAAQTPPPDALNRLLRLIDEATLLENHASLAALFRLGYDPAVVTSRLKQLALAGRNTQAAAATLYEVSADDARQLIPTFVEWIEDREAKRGWLALMGLAGLGEDAAPALPAIIGHFDVPLNNEDPTPRYLSELTLALEALGPAAVGAVPAIAKCIDDSAGVPHERRLEPLFHVLASLGPAAHEAVPALIRYLDRSVPQNTSGTFQGQFVLSRFQTTPAHAIDALRRIGVWNDDVRRCLHAQQAAGDPGPRSAALAAIAALDPDRSRAAMLLAAALEDDSYLVRRAAAGALAEMGPAAAPAVPALQAALRDRRNRLLPESALGGDEQILVIRGVPGIAWGAFRRRGESVARERTVHEAAAAALRRIGAEHEIPGAGSPTAASVPPD